MRPGPAYQLAAGSGWQSFAGLIPGGPPAGFVQAVLSATADLTWRMCPAPATPGGGIVLPEGGSLLIHEQQQLAMLHVQGPLTINVQFWVQ